MKARDLAGLLAYSFLLGILGIWNRNLPAHDEPRVAGIARAMALTGDYVTPRLNGTAFLEYPNLGYLPSALSLAAAGAPSDFAAHLPYVFLGMATVLFTALMGVRKGTVGEGDSPQSLTAAYLLATTIGFWDLHTRVLVDASLLLSITASLCGFHRAASGGSRAWAALFWLGIAGGFLSKGLLGIGVPLAVALGTAVASRFLGASPRLRFGRNLGWLWGPPLAAAPIALWMALLARGEGRAAVDEVFRQSLWRFGSETAHHAGPIYFYFGPVSYKTAPLAVVVLLFLASARRRTAAARAAAASTSTPTPTPERGAFTFPLVWFLAVFCALSLASAKREIYLAPLYPAAALLGALLWDRLRPALPIPQLWERGWLAGFGAFALAMAVTSPTSEDLAKDYRPAFEAVAAARRDEPLLLLRPTESLEGAAVFLTSGPVPEARDPAALRAALERAPATIVVTELLDRQPNPLDGVGAPFTVTTLRELPLGRSRIVISRAAR